MAALKEVISAVPKDIPVLLDAKRGDIGTTAAAYASAAFEVGQLLCLAFWNGRRCDSSGNRTAIPVCCGRAWLRVRFV